MEYVISIKLISDTLIGSALSSGNVIDTDVVFDDLGLPYIPAKRVKGILRNACQDLVEQFHIILPKSIQLTNVDDLFGDVGKNTPVVTFNVTNLYLPDYEKLREEIRYASSLSNLVSSQNVLGYFTSLRKQTAIDEKKPGIAKEHSLRTMRVVNKKHEFVGKLTIDNTNPDIEYLLGLVSLYADRMGTTRNHGLGSINLEIIGSANLKDLAVKELEAIYAQA